MCARARDVNCVCLTHKSQMNIMHARVCVFKFRALGFVVLAWCYVIISVTSALCTKLHNHHRARASSSANLSLARISARVHQARATHARTHAQRSAYHRRRSVSSGDVCILSRAGSFDASGATHTRTQGASSGARKASTTFCGDERRTHAPTVAHTYTHACVCLPSASQPVSQLAKAYL